MYSRQQGQRLELVWQEDARDKKVRRLQIRRGVTLVRYTLVQDVCHLVMRCLLETEAADRRREVSMVKKDLSGGKAWRCLVREWRKVVQLIMIGS